MDRLEKIRDLDDLVFEEYQKYFPEIMKSKFSKQFPNTFHISNQFTISTNFIKNSIFECAVNDDLFGIKILFRSEIEHFLRFKYINFNWVKFKTDEISQRYIEFTQARELLDQINSTISEHKLSNPDFNVSWQELFDKIPNLKKYSKNEIINETKKYTYRNIIKLLQEIDKKSNKKISLLGSLITEYSELSSFVHGGAGAHNQMQIFNIEQKRIDEYIRICGLAFQMAATVKLFSLMMLMQTDNVIFDEYYLKLDNYIKKATQI